ncbi:solute carrier family 23 protein, partial [Klebsiella pneumoniae]|uniref:solute carrier family 23 protein n=1 Tax=Klebsiella pneumoniae TaxID=573 RepID=UPI0027300E7E
RPPPPQTLCAAFQHRLAMCVAVITPALFIGQAHGRPAQDTQHIISLSLFAAGVASVSQRTAWGPGGAGRRASPGARFSG